MFALQYIFLLLNFDLLCSSQFLLIKCKSILFRFLNFTIDIYYISKLKRSECYLFQRLQDSSINRPKMIWKWNYIRIHIHIRFLSLFLYKCDNFSEEIFLRKIGHIHHIHGQLAQKSLEIGQFAIVAIGKTVRCTVYTFFHCVSINLSLYECGLHSKHSMSLNTAWPYASKEAI